MKGLVEYLHRIKNASPNKTSGTLLELVWDGEEHLTLPEISKKHGIKYVTLHKRLRNMGLSGPDLVSKPGPGGKKPRLVWDGEEHLTLTSAAKKHGVSREALYYRHKHLGLSGEQLIKGFRAARKPKKNSAQEHAA